MSEKTNQTDVVILGAGLIGLTQALTLAAHGLRVAIIDRAEPADLVNPQNDARVSAINSASWNMFEAIGLADQLRPYGCNIDRILVNDGLKPGKLDFTPDDDEPLGVMVENAVSRRVLFEAVQAHEAITLYMPTQVDRCDRGEHRVDVTLVDGRMLSAPLLIAADGRGSRMREEAGIIMANWQYDHNRSEEHTSELQSRSDLVCRLLLEKKKKTQNTTTGDQQTSTIAS